MGIYFNNREITKELFVLDDSKLNREGLYEYAMNIGENLGVDYCFVIQPNGEQLEHASYSPEENNVFIPSRFIDEGLTEREYRVTKGIIDHETGHILWPDHSFLFDDSYTNEEHHLIWDIGNIIEDIRIERRMVKEFHVDKNNFRYLYEMHYSNWDALGIKHTFSNYISMFSLSVNVIYRETDIFFFNHKNVSGWELFNNKLKPVVDRFLQSNEKAGDTAKEIIRIIKDSMNISFRVIKELKDKSYIIEMEGKAYWLSFSEDAYAFLDVGDTYYTECINWMSNFVVNLQDVPPEGYVEER